MRVGAAPLLASIVAENANNAPIHLDVFPQARGMQPAQAPNLLVAPNSPVMTPAALPAAPAPIVAAPVTPHLRKSAQMMFDNRPIRVARTMRMVVTGYSPDARSCGASADGITASGFSVWTNGMKMVAADTRILPFNSLVAIPGYNDGKPVPVYDRGGAIKGNRLDLLFPTHEQARRWGRKTMTITVWEYAD